MANDDDTTPPSEGNNTEEGVQSTSDTEPQKESVSAQVDDFAQHFKSAAQKVLEERFGMEQKDDGRVDFTKIDSEQVKHNAQALITGLMSQIAGITPPSASADKAAQPPAAEDNVIDLESARRAREPREPSALERRMSENIKATFNNYVQENLVPNGSSGQVKLNVDGDMLKEHGPQVLTALFGAFTQSIFPEGGVEVDLPSENTPKVAKQSEESSEESEEGAESEAQEETSGREDKGKVDVKLNVDMAGLFRSLIEGVQTKK